jgi:protein arginine kinase activator
MVCERCQEREAEVHLTTIENDEMATVHLCSSCAGQEGISAFTSAPAPLADFLATIGASVEDASEGAVSEPCQYCGTSSGDFRRSGRLGCPECYTHFEGQLRGLLRRVHGSTQHVGKLYLGEATDTDNSYAKLRSLRLRLDRAVELEDFESAAELRDRINVLEAAER